MHDTSYSTEYKNSLLLKIKEVVSTLPPFCNDFFRYLSNKNLSVRTRYSYALEIKKFLVYLITEVPCFSMDNIRSFSIKNLAMVEANHIEMYLDYISIYKDDSRTVTNDAAAKARKLAALRSFMKYYYKYEMIPNNVAALIDTPKLSEKAIIRLEANQVADLLDEVEDGSSLTRRQQAYHESTKERDLAIITLFLGTGIRISELVGIDLKDVDFDNRTFLITRKGGKQDILSFGDEVNDALIRYKRAREKMIAAEGHENAFFLSMQRKRISVKAVENLVKKYAVSAVPLKKITPHKLRSTFGTMLYHETGDIYLVADVLGHKDVNTTRKHYADQSAINKRNAAKAIHLRED